MQILTTESHGVYRAKNSAQGTNTFYWGNASILTTASVSNRAPLPLQRESDMAWQYLGYTILHFS